MTEVIAKLKSAPARGAAWRGQAAVEFAIVSIVMFALLYGIIEVSRLVFINSEVENAAREGARYAALHDDVTVDSLRATVYSKLTLADHAATTITGPDYPEGSRCLFCRVEVGITYDWTTLVSFLNLGPVELRASSTQLIETP
jgi:Flp pilus assembly protein TadG